MRLSIIIPCDNMETYLPECIDSLLDQEELENFACLYGNEIGRRQRCAVTHYSEVIKQLDADHRFQHLAGRYLDVVPNSENEFVLKYLATSNGEETLDTHSPNIFINCIGSEILDNKNITPLYKNLLASGTCVPINSLRGFKVNENLEASDNIHVVGPLLAGNVIEGMALWHLEHCGRII